jgi:hypothetical protein
MNAKDFIYAVIMFVVVFLIKPELKIKVIRRKSPTMARFELSDWSPKKR